MKKNMGNTDRVIRTTLAAGIITLAAAKIIKGTTAAVLLGFSAIFLSTSAVGHCPAYAAIDIDTLPK